MYLLLRKLLFLFDAESVHYFTMNSLKAFCKVPFARALLRKMYAPKALPVTAFGLQFKNPVGLAAGFDKNAKYLRELSTLGFGFIEIGTVTPLPQQGNARPRLFRLPKDEAIINRMGFNNDGAAAVVNRLKEFREKKTDVIIGGNIGKNKDTPNENAVDDYEKCFLALYDFVDYFVVNVSSPNTPGLRDLQQVDSLRTILTHLQHLRDGQTERKPVLLKIAPDLSNEDISDIVKLAIDIDLDGLVVSNTTISREGLETGEKEIAAIGAGGLSGRPLLKRSSEVLQKTLQVANNDITMIASGGITTPNAAITKMTGSVLLVQIYTGLIYKGPGLIKRIVRAIQK